jgi:SAM-dependent methyltransferase
MNNIVTLSYDMPENQYNAVPSGQSSEAMCRFCGTQLRTVFADLGMSPLSNAYVRPENRHRGESFFPLTVYVCDSCYLVQLLQYESPDIIFSDYAYFSSYSDSWLAHSSRYVDMITERLKLGNNHLVVELASNDGYLLQYFIEKKIPVLGIEPAENVAKVAREKGVSTISRFFGIALAQELLQNGKSADLIIGNNVLAHVPDINDFVSGMKTLLKPEGVITMEFPHLLQLIENNQFDTIYHEHFSYLSLLSVEKIFNHHGLQVFDVEELATHGGSLRIYAAHDQSELHTPSEPIRSLRDKEHNEGLTDIGTYRNFTEKVQRTKRILLTELIRLKNEGKKIIAYGAAAKGNTLLNFCGIRTDIVEYVVDRNPHKVGKLLPGTHIPIHSIDRLDEDRPDYLLILPWNLKEEIIEQNKFIRSWGGRFIVPIPEVSIID